MITFNQMISLGAGYRTHVGLMARLGLNIKDFLYLGYAYEFSGANISSYSTGSHEVLLGVKFCKNSTIEQSISSFEDTEEITSNSKQETKEIVKSLEEEKAIELIEDKVVEENIIENEVEEEKKNNSSDFKKSYKPQILFPYNDATNYDLSNNYELDKLANFLKNNNNEKIIVVGHACDIGSEEGNLKVSQQRADKVYNALVKKGVSPSQLSKKAEGESKPLFPNNSDENRIKNRRVEIVFAN